MNTLTRLGAAALATILLVGCASENADVRKALVAKGFSESVAGELSTLSLKPDEINNLGEAKAQGIDEKVLLAMVESLHDKDRQFVIGTDLRLLTSTGMTAETAAALVDLGALPGWGDDVRALKEAGVSDGTIVDIAKVKYAENKSVISGTSLARLKTVQMSDAGLLRFVQKGGDEIKLEAVARALAMGTPEEQALTKAGL